MLRMERMKPTRLHGSQAGHITDRKEGGAEARSDARGFVISTFPDQR